MGWLRLVGSLKWHVSFAEYRLFHRSLLHKRPIIWRSVLIVATPHVQCRQYRWSIDCVHELLNWLETLTSRSSIDCVHELLDWPYTLTSRCSIDWGRRRISHWKWKLTFVPRKLRYPPEKLSFQFSPILAFTGLILRKRYIYIYLVPIPSNPLCVYMYFEKARSFPSWGGDP